MENVLASRLTLTALALLLSGCIVGGVPQYGAQNGAHLSPTECRDLAALKSQAPPTMAEHQSELAALRKAGYNPSPWNDDPYYPDDLQAAQRLVDYWFATECQALLNGG
jgi:hypothetical protein